jgi:hypothetical protein
MPDTTFSWKSGLSAFAVGLTWGLGSAGVAFALMRFHTPISVLSPLFNMNTLVKVLLSLIFLRNGKK